MNPETSLMNKITVALAEDRVLLFRNNTGAYKTDAGHFVRFGVGGRGGSDLIGAVPVTITPDMVGRTVAVFAALEVKTKTGCATKEQQNFLAAVARQGGIAGVVRSPDEAAETIQSWMSHDTNNSGRMG